MSVGKRKWQVHLDKRRIPEPCCNAVWGFVFSFMVAKHPPGYLLPLSCLSSHLLMRWQAKPAATVSKKDSTYSVIMNAYGIPYR